MGYAKYFEDNERIITVRQYYQGFTKSPEPKPIEYKCYYCNLLFESIESRNNHIKNDHNVIDPLLLINGKIATSENYVENIETIKIALCGFYNVNIFINNKKVEADHQKADIDLTTEFSNNVDQYTLKIGNKTYLIKKYSKIDIVNPIIEKIIGKWEEQTEKKETLSPPIQMYPNSLNEAEKEYLYGFYNYYIACESNIKPEDRNNRYNTAYALLSKFNNLPPKANFLLKVIAFKLNWIQTLENLTGATQGQGIFDFILDFYYGRDSNVDKTENKNVKKIYVEDEISEYLETVYGYQTKNNQKADDFLKQWNDEEINLIEDYNKKDRILFLKGTMCSKRYFNDIRTPFLRKIINIKFNEKEQQEK